jgi:4-amino-4-deoxy-L-arabinose transferase-like glycosyltransferase
LGIIVGLGTLVRPFALLTLIALGVALWRAGAGPREALRAVGIAAGIAVLVLIPWTARNAFAYHAFVPVSTNLGDTLCLDNSPGAYGGFRALPPECTVTNPYQGFNELPNGRNEPKENSHNLRYAVAWAVRHPGREAGLVFRRTFYGYRDDHDGLTDQTGTHGTFPPPRVRHPLRWLADVYYYVVLALALFGSRKFVHDPRRLFVLLVALSLAVVPLFLYGLIRFHIPLLPFLALGAAVTIDSLERKRNVSSRSDGTA